MKDYLTIGEVSKITNLPISTLRYYDSEGIISPNYKDEKTNYRYYRFFQIPIIKMIIHLKKLGFNNLEIKSHLENKSYSHTLELINKMRAQTKVEIERLQKVEKELEENAIQMKHLINLENNLNKFFIEEEEIRGVYSIVDNSLGDEGISQAFKDINNFLISIKEILAPVGVYAFTIKRENIEKKSYIYDRLILLNDYENHSRRCYYPKRKYACIVCQSKFDEIGKNIERTIEWMKENGQEIGGDVIINILSGPAFEKDPSDVMYVLKIPTK